VCHVAAQSRKFTKPYATDACGQCCEGWPGHTLRRIHLQDPVSIPPPGPHAAKLARCISKISAKFQLLIRLLCRGGGRVRVDAVYNTSAIRHKYVPLFRTVRPGTSMYERAPYVRYAVLDAQVGRLIICQVFLTFMRLLYGSSTVQADRAGCE
jgi:hypothetical protein